MSVAQTTKHQADQVQAAAARGSAATSAVVASWRRSSNFHRLDPAECSLPRRLSQAEFELARQQIEPLVRAAQSNLDRLFLAVGGVGCCVALAGRNRGPVARRGACGPVRSGARRARAPTASEPVWPSNARLPFIAISIFMRATRC